MDGHRIVSLLKLNTYVFCKVFVVSDAASASLQLVDNGFIASDGGAKVYEALLELHELQEVFIADAALEGFFRFHDKRTDLLEVLQEPHGRAVYEAEDEIGLARYHNFFASVVPDKVGH